VRTDTKKPIEYDTNLFAGLGRFDCPSAALDPSARINSTLGFRLDQDFFLSRQIKYQIASGIFLEKLLNFGLGGVYVSSRCNPLGTLFCHPKNVVGG
jgi:hypothetical protein